MGPTTRPTLLASVRRFRRRLRECVRIDTRTLAVVRVFVGLLVVAELLLRARNFEIQGLIAVQSIGGCRATRDRAPLVIATGALEVVP